MTVVPTVNTRTDVPSEVRILLRQHWTLEISPFIAIITVDLLQLGLVTRNRVTRSWSVVNLVILVKLVWIVANILCAVY